MNWIMSETSGKMESGQGMVEYGLILVLVSIVAIVALGDVGKTLKTKFEEINTQLSTEASSSNADKDKTDKDKTKDKVDKDENNSI